LPACRRFKANGRCGGDDLVTARGGLRRKCRPGAYSHPGVGGAGGYGRSQDREMKTALERRTWIGSIRAA